MKSSWHEKAWRQAALPAWFRKLRLIDERIENGQYSRACGDCRCEVCGRLLYAHPNYVPWLTLLCNGDLVHL